MEWVWHVVFGESLSRADSDPALGILAAMMQAQSKAIDAAQVTAPQAASASSSGGGSAAGGWEATDRVLVGRPPCAAQRRKWLSGPHEPRRN